MRKINVKWECSVCREENVAEIDLFNDKEDVLICKVCNSPHQLELTFSADCHLAGLPAFAKEMQESYV